jgi:hypothetical protein
MAQSYWRAEIYPDDRNNDFMFSDASLGCEYRRGDKAWTSDYSLGMGFIIEIDICLKCHKILQSRTNMLA